MSSSNTDESKTDFFIGPIAGGEYMLHKDFSLGGEIQLNYISVGHYEDATNVYDRTETIISTRALIFIRWYL
jgi:hypothetical protein